LSPGEELDEHSAENNAEQKRSQARTERTERYVFKYVKDNEIALHQIKKVEHIKNSLDKSFRNFLHPHSA
jgi:hypothetical protein